jgi:predicted secreted hydrolase
VTARRIAAALIILALAATPAVASPDLRTAGPADNAAHPGEGKRTEWWFVSAIDPAQKFAVAAALGAEFPSNPPATVVFLYMPDGSVHTVAAPRTVTVMPSTQRADVQLGPDRLWSPRPGITRVVVDIPKGIALHGGSPGPVSLDLTLRATSPGFVAGPLTLPEGQDLSWTVGAPSATVSGVVRIGDRTVRLRDAVGYHDHNFGEFDLADDAHGGWDWSEIQLPAGRSLVTGIVRPAAPFPRDGVLVLSDGRRRLGSARAEDVTIRRSRWSKIGRNAYPRQLLLTARLSDGWSVRVRYRAQRAAPLGFRLDGSSALVEVETRASGQLRHRGRVVSRWSDAPGFYEYESTPITRERDAAPGTTAWAGRRAMAVGQALRA